MTTRMKEKRLTLAMYLNTTNYYLVGSNIVFKNHVRVGRHFALPGSCILVYNSAEKDNQ